MSSELFRHFRVCQCPDRVGVKGASRLRGHSTGVNLIYFFSELTLIIIELS